MKIYPIVLCLLLLSTITIFAQAGSDMVRMSPVDRVEAANEEVTKILDLSSQQKTAINFLHKDLYLKDVPKRGSLRSMTSTEREAFFQKRKEKQVIYKESMEAILTKEQWQKWEKYQELKREGSRAKTGRRSGRGGTRGRQ